MLQLWNVASTIMDSDLSWGIGARIAEVGREGAKEGGREGGREGWREGGWREEGREVDFRLGRQSGGVPLQCNLKVLHGMYSFFPPHTPPLCLPPALPPSLPFSLPPPSLAT